MSKVDRSPQEDAAYYGSIWHLSNAQMAELERVFTSHRLNAVEQDRSRRSPMPVAFITCNSGPDIKPSVKITCATLAAEQKAADEQAAREADEVYRAAVVEAAAVAIAMLHAGITPKKAREIAGNIAAGLVPGVTMEF